MPINYALFENPLTPNPTDYTARVEITGSAGKELLLERMLAQGSTVTSSDILAVIEDLTKATESLLLEGFRVNIGDLVQVYPRIRGTYDGPTDTFDPSRHTLDAAAAIGPRIRNTIRDRGQPHKNETHIPTPNITNYEDLVTGQTTTPSTPTASAPSTATTSNTTKPNPTKASTSSTPPPKPKPKSSTSNKTNPPNSYSSTPTP